MNSKNLLLTFHAFAFYWGKKARRICGHTFSLKPRFSTRPIHFEVP